MIESIRQWIINISAIIIFITAVQLILPDNSLKKYAKYVLGLLVILVMINPILKFLNSDYSMEQYSTKAEEYFKSNNSKDDLEKYKKINEEKTLETFKSNLSKQCKEKLKTYYKKDDFKVDIAVEYNKESHNIIIKSISIGLESGNIKKIDPIVIGEQEKQVTNHMEDKEKEVRIKEIVEKEFGLESNKIKVYELE